MVLNRKLSQAELLVATWTPSQTLLGNSMELICHWHFWKRFFNFSLLSCHLRFSDNFPAVSMKVSKLLSFLTFWVFYMQSYAWLLWFTLLDSVWWDLFPDCNRAWKIKYFQIPLILSAEIEQRLNSTIKMNEASFDREWSPPSEFQIHYLPSKENILEALKAILSGIVRNKSYQVHFLGKNSSSCLNRGEVYF